MVDESDERKPLLVSQANITQGPQRIHDVEASVSPPENSNGDRLQKETQYWLRRLLWAAPLMLIAQFLAAAEQTLIASTYGTIASDLNALQQADWIATSYFLTLAAFQPLYGKLSDIFGRKSCYLVAQAIFASGCLACGFANSMPSLIAARAWTGVGGAGITTMLTIIYNEIIPMKDRGKWTSCTNITWALGAGLGGPIGGVLTDGVGWRWSFFVQVPIAFVGFIGTAALLKLPVHQSSHWIEKCRRIDVPGAACLITAILSFMIGFDHGSNVSWKSSFTLGCLCVSIATTVVFVLVELKVATNPIIPGRVLQKSLVACYTCNFFYYGAWMAALFNIPLFLQATRGYSATHAGSWLLPSVIASLIGSLLAGFIMRWTGRFFHLTAWSFFAFFTGTLSIALFTGTVAVNIWGIWIGLLIAGFFYGIVNNSLMIAMVANVSSADQATATACYYLFRSLGSVVVISTAASIVQDSLRHFLADSLPLGQEADRVAQLVRESLDNIQSLEPEIQLIVQECYAQATSSGFLACAVASMGAFLVAWFIRNKSLFEDEAH